MQRPDTESEELLAARLRLATEAAEIGTWDFDPISGELFCDARCKAAVQNALDPTGAGSYDIEYRTVWPDGEIRWVRAAGRGLFSNDDSRRAVRFMGTVQDITDS